MPLAVRDLEVSFRTYGGSVSAVRGVNLDVSEGECLAIVGESGCGKSVTAQTVMRLIPSPPAEIRGSVTMDGVELLALPEKRMKEIRGAKIGMIFQDPMTSLDPTMQIGKQIMEALTVHDRGLKPLAAADRVIEVLGMVGIPNPEKQFRRYAYEFSGGMRQRVVIAMAVICSPRLLIADEPTTALDVTTQAQILDLIRDLKTKLRTSVVIITHDMGVVANMADRIAVFYAGQVVEEGRSEDVFLNPSHPYTAALLMSRPSLDWDRGQKLASVPGTPPDLFAPPAGCGFFDRCAAAMEVCREALPEFFETENHEGVSHRSLCWLHHPSGKTELARWLSGGRGLKGEDSQC
ncbi:MAG: ABC transporter ATP-binding protein [Synergistaceae bacterium]|nr:ABC transporter ATP-binding protein [Synergistaceae bacterium]